MNSADKIKRFFKKAELGINPDADEKVFNDMLAQQKTKEQVPAKPEIWRITMKSPIVKLAAAAVIIVLVVLGLFEFIGTENTSGVVWAEVARKVQSSRGVVYREKGSSTEYKYPKGPGYNIIYLVPKYYRSDGYNGEGELWISMYDNRETGIRIVLLHGQKGYVREKMTMTEAGDQKHADTIDPRKWVQKFMSCKYSKLGQKTIDGVLSEGIETTDLTLVGGAVNHLQIDSFVARLWVSVETGYPVLLKGEFTGQHSGNMVIDQFQWDVELDPSVFEPNIPPDYEQM